MTITAGGTVIAGGAADKTEDPQGFTVSFSDADSVEPIIGADGPAMFRRKNRSASCSFSVMYERATPDDASAFMLGWNDNFLTPVTTTFAVAAGTIMTLADSLVSASNITQQGCTVTIQWQITGRVA